MTNLVSAYQNDDIGEFEKILRTNRPTIMEDPFIREHIEDLLRNIRTQVLVKLIRPYTRVRISFIARELNIEPEEVESLLVACILDSAVHGRIDQVNQILELDQEPQGSARWVWLELQDIRLLEGKNSKLGWFCLEAYYTSFPGPPPGILWFVPINVHICRYTTINSQVVMSNSGEIEDASTPTSPPR